MFLTHLQLSIFSHFLTTTFIVLSVLCLIKSYNPFIFIFLTNLPPLFPLFIMFRYYQTLSLKRVFLEIIVALPFLYIYMIVFNYDILAYMGHGNNQAIFFTILGTSYLIYKRIFIPIHFIVYMVLWTSIMFLITFQINMIHSFQYFSIAIVMIIVAFLKFNVNLTKKDMIIYLTHYVILLTMGVAYLFMVHNIYFKILISIYTTFFVIYLLSRFMFIMENIYNKPLYTKPFIFSITGDSGSGKTYLTGFLQNALKEEMNTLIEGDGFHKWEREDVKWESITHLNPAANNIHELYKTVFDLIKIRKIQVRQYNHNNGTFYHKLVIPKKTILLEGLHGLSIKPLRDITDLKIFLDTDQQKQQEWKIRRDVEIRHHNRDQVLDQIKKREFDRNKYLLPQREFADIIVNYYEHEGVLYSKYSIKNQFNLEPFLFCFNHKNITFDMDLKYWLIDLIDIHLSLEDLTKAYHFIKEEFNSLGIPINIQIANNKGVDNFTLLMVFYVALEKVRGY